MYKTVSFLIQFILFILQQKEEEYFTNSSEDRSTSRMPWQCRIDSVRKNKNFVAAPIISAGAIAGNSPDILYFCGWPGAKNNDVVPAIEFGVAATTLPCDRRRVRVSFPIVCVRYIRRRVRVLEEIYNGTRARKASRRWASCVTSSSVGMCKYTSCEARRAKKRGKEEERDRKRVRQTCALYTRPPWIYKKPWLHMSAIRDVRVERRKRIARFNVPLDRMRNLSERGRDEKFNLCQITRSRSEIATGETRNIRFFAGNVYPVETKEIEGMDQSDIYCEEFYTFLKDQYYYTLKITIFKELKGPLDV